MPATRQPLEMLPPIQALRLVQLCIQSDYLMNAIFWVKYLLKSIWSFVHNILMVGSLETGKTLLVRAISGETAVRWSRCWEHCLTK